MRRSVEQRGLSWAKTNRKPWYLTSTWRSISRRALVLAKEAWFRDNVRYPGPVKVLNEMSQPPIYIITERIGVGAYLAIAGARHRYEGAIQLG